MSATQLATRYDALAKVTGRAKYAAEFRHELPPDLVYAHMVPSAIASGTVASIDTAAAQRSPGVLAVLTPFNASKLPGQVNRTLSLMQDTTISYAGQPIAVVVANSLPEAVRAAALLDVRYTLGPIKADFLDGIDGARWPSGPGGSPGKDSPGNHRGDVAAGFEEAAVVVEGTYITPIQHHNPMEPHATIAWWEGDKLSLYDATQGIFGVRQSLARIFNIPMENIRVQCPNTGGGFGTKGTMWSQTPLCAMAAKLVGKPVKLVLDRGQMYGPVGARPNTYNRIKLGAASDGKLLAMWHEAFMYASPLNDFVERSTSVTRILYNSRANSATEKMVDLNFGPGTWMRAPGEATGTAVVEVAMDELAAKLKMDPVQLRLVNYAETDPSNGKPWTSKHLRECYEQAGKRFGWEKRNPTPGQAVEGNSLIGMGMATATYPANRGSASAVVRILPNGRAYAACGTQDIGTGTYTIIAQTAADALGLDPKLVEAGLGDTDMPRGPGSGGSTTAATVCPAVHNAAVAALAKLTALAVADAQSPLHGCEPSEIAPRDGKLVHRQNPSHADAFAAILARNGNQPVEATADAEPEKNRAQFSSHSFGAVFAEVAVDRTTFMVKVRRVVATYDIGTLINDTTGHSQLMGGIVWGIGFALQEHTVVDANYGRIVNANLGEYHVTVNADVGHIDVTALNIPDTNFNPLGARGIGEIGLTGAAAAIANAIYNATGKRVREYPITPDKIMQA